MSVRTQQRATANSYSFVSSPRALKGRKAFRSGGTASQQSPGKTVNIATDPRIRRGPTVLRQQMPSEEEIRAEEERLRRLKRQKALQRQKERQEREAREVVPPVEGREHMEIQTEQFLEEITDRPVEKEVETQTDPFVDRPPTPLYVPLKSGIDFATQIDPDDKDLFDFDQEVQPVLSVLVAKTLEQAMMEVVEEEEMAAVIEAQERYAAHRALELKEANRMEDEERRREEEKERRIAQEKRRLEKESRERDKAVAQEQAKTFLEELTPSVFNELTSQGYFYDPLLREVETHFLPWLNEQLDAHIASQLSINDLVDHLIHNALSVAITSHHSHKEILEKQIQEEIQMQLQLEAQRQQEEDEKRLRNRRDPDHPDYDPDFDEDEDHDPDPEE